MFEQATHINEYRAAVEAEGDPAFFKFYDKGDYFVGNYISVMAKFPSLTEEGLTPEQLRNRTLLRDMRGIIFDRNGRVISKPLHKFHNLNEGVDNQADVLDWSEFEVYDKLDGSMIRPVIINGMIRWCTKAGVTHMTPDLEAFVERNPWYLDFARVWLDMDYTPIFEYMAPKHRIVVDYGPEEKMTLLAIRDNVTGQYLAYNELMLHCAEFEIPLVRRWEVKSHTDLLTEVSDLRNAEGIIIRFPNDHRVKVKSLHYLNLHKNREAIERERYVAMMALQDSIDDLLPLVPEYIQPRLQKYAEDFLNAFYDISDVYYGELVKALQAVRFREDRKDFALNNDIPGWLKAIGFKMYDGWFNKRSGDPEMQADFSFAEFETRMKDLIIKHADRSDTAFTTEVKNGIFAGYENKIPAWNIWDHSMSED